MTDRQRLMRHLVRCITRFSYLKTSSGFKLNLFYSEISPPMKMFRIPETCSENVHPKNFVGKDFLYLLLGTNFLIA